MSTFRRRLMSILSGKEPLPEFYNYLVGDGVAYVDTGIRIPENGSMAGVFGYETRRAGAQNIFGAFDVGAGETGLTFGGGTDNNYRQIVAFYDKTANVGYNTLNFNYKTFASFLTPKRFGYGDSSKTFTKGNLRPTATLKIFGGYPTYTSYSGLLSGDFMVFGADAQNAATWEQIMAFTPVATFRPCIYNGEAGLWYVEEKRFCGNAAGSGSFIAKNTI